MIKAGVSHEDAMLQLELKQVKSTRPSEEEKIIINKMKADGKSACAIGVAIGRSTKTVIRFLKKNIMCQD